MHVPSRSTVVVCGLLAVLTPALGVLMAKSYFVDGGGGHGAAVFYLLYWPVLLLQALPERIAVPLAGSPFLVLLMYFGAYLLVDQLVRAAFRALRRTFARHPDKPA